MSKHIGRKQRWTRESASRYGSDLGAVVYERGAWYALVNYQTLVAGAPAHELPSWEAHRERLGPFKRPRNAMVALEREVTFLRNHHGGNVRVGDRLWAET
jgi:hypothetical protein